MVEGVWYACHAMGSRHPCSECPAKASHGVIACPVAAAVLNKGRCRRVRAMTPAVAMPKLAQARLSRWELATETGDRRVLSFLRWHSVHEAKAAMLLRGLTPE